MRPGVEVTLMGLLLAGCATTGHPTSPSALAESTLTITEVGVDPKTLERDQQQVATIRYRLSQPATVTVDLVNEEGVVVHRLEESQQRAGAHTITWDGRAADGELVLAGVYRYIMTARAVDRGPSTVDYTYDPSHTTGGEELAVTEFTFDNPTGTLRWMMPKAGYARLRVGLQGFPHLRTLMDWTPLEAGKHELLWDGLDASGLIRLTEHPNLSIKLHAFALPWNTIIVKHQQTADSAKGGSASGGSTQQTELGTTDYGLPTTDLTHPPLFRSDASYLHARHPRPRCHEAQVRVVFPDGTRYDTHERPMLSGTVPVRVVLDERDAPRLVNSRFEVALFEDTTFLMEEEDGANPFTYLWDTTTLTPGEHLLTVNILSYDDHYGLLTVPVQIERAP